MNTFKIYETFFLFYRRYTPLDNSPPERELCYPFAHGMVCPPSRANEPVIALLNLSKNNSFGGQTISSLHDIMRQNPELEKFTVVEDTGDTLILTHTSEPNKEFEYHKRDRSWKTIEE